MPFPVNGADLSETNMSNMSDLKLITLVNFKDFKIGLVINSTNHAINDFL